MVYDITKNKVCVEFILQLNSGVWYILLYAHAYNRFGHGTQQRQSFQKYILFGVQKCYLPENSILKKCIDK